MSATSPVLTITPRRLPLHTRLLASVCLVFFSSLAAALELGFEGRLALEFSDNIESVNSPEEERGQRAGAVFGVYGEQRGRKLAAAFRGEIDTRRIISEEDSSFDTLTRFLGAAELALTPRSWKWYVGDILGGVRTDDAIQTIDETAIDRRNVFVTGPSFEDEVVGVSRTRARLLYVNQTEESERLETLYTVNASHERDTTPGSFYGIRAGNVFTDLPEASAAGNRRQGSNYNRSTLALYAKRERGRNELFGELGVTRYDADEQTLDGFNARAEAIRQLGPQTTVSVSLRHDLNDQALSTVESLIAAGGDSVAVRPEVSGFFAETRLDVGYSFLSTDTIASVGVGIAQQDYRLLGTGALLNLDADDEDQRQGFAYASLSRRLSSRLRSEFSLGFERQIYDNRVDESDSTLAIATLLYRIGRSFELEAGLVHDRASGRITRFNTGTAVEEDVDLTENRAIIGIRWAPPSRASQELTVELKSLLQ